MDIPLLDTKLYSPTVRTRRVARQRLYARLDPLLRANLGLVSAPAGYGKTTLVVDWLNHLAERRDIVVPQVTWLSLDESDNDPARFLSYLIAALQSVYTDAARTVQAVLSTDAPLALEPLIITLINDIASAPTQCVLVLDDYHLITNGTIHDALDFMLDHLPPQLHLLICTRADPPLALGRFRVRNNLVEVRQAHLAFGVDEASAFLEQSLGMTLSEDQVATLATRTEGWIAGLQLAALSLRDAGLEDRQRFIDRFSGSHQHIASFLLDEAFSHQDALTRRFLMRTSIVDHFCASLSDAIVGDVDLQGFDMLDRLETGDLFLVPLDPEHEWYRYHHLFRDFLRDRLAHQSPALIPELHMRASHWFAEHGRMYAAIEEALAAGSPDRAATLIDSLGCRLALEGSDAQTLGWIEQIPEPLHRHHPWLRVAQLNALCGMERYDRLMPLIESIEADLGLFPGLPIATCVLLVRAWCTMRTHYEPQMLLRYGLQAREQLAGLPDSDANRLLRAIAELYIGHGHWNLGHRSAAEAAFEAMVRHGRQSHSLPVTLRAYVQQALFYQAVGPFHRCAEICAQGIEMAERAWSEHTVPAPPAELVAHLEGLLALMLLLWHRIEEAEVHARRAVALFELGGSQVGHHIEAGLLNLAWAHCARGEDANAYAVLRHCDRLLQGCSQPVNRQVKPKLVRLRIGLAHARPEWRHLMRDVESWVHECRLDPEHLEKNQVRDYEAYGCGLMAIGRAAEAIPWLERGLNKTQEQGWVLSEMLFAIWLAVAHDQVGNAKQAVETMANALALAEPEGCLQIFLEYGPLALVLLRRIRAMLPHRAPPFSQITPEFVDSVLVLFPERAVAAAPEPPTAPVTQPLIEPLSERELDVLHLVACGLRNQEIADRLYVTINTVGFHLKNIYGKLDVHSRSEAIVTAHALGLIPWTHTPGH